MELLGLPHRPIHPPRHWHPWEQRPLIPQRQPFQYTRPDRQTLQFRSHRQVLRRHPSDPPQQPRRHRQLGREQPAPPTLPHFPGQRLPQTPSARTRGCHQQYPSQVQRPPCLHRIYLQQQLRHPGQSRLTPNRINDTSHFSGGTACESMPGVKGFPKKIGLTGHIRPIIRSAVRPQAFPNLGQPGLGGVKDFVDVLFLA